MGFVFKPWVTYFCRIFEKVRKYSLRTPEIKKKDKKISLQTSQELRKNKKKIGSNAKNLGNLEPQPEQTFLIKKKCMVTVGKYKDNYDTATKPANKSMGFDSSAIQSCLFLLLESTRQPRKKIYQYIRNQESMKHSLYAN